MSAKGKQRTYIRRQRTKSSDSYHGFIRSSSDFDRVPEEEEEEFEGARDSPKRRGLAKQGSRKHANQQRVKAWLHDRNPSHRHPRQYGGKHHGVGHMKMKHRRHLRKIDRRENKAATKVQSLYRGKVARTQYAMRRERTLAEHEEEERRRAATRIQAARRGHIDRMKLARQKREKGSGRERAPSTISRQNRKMPDQRSKHGGMEHWREEHEQLQHERQSVHEMQWKQTKRRRLKEDAIYQNRVDEILRNRSATLIQSVYRGRAQRNALAHGNRAVL